MKNQRKDRKLVFTKMIQVLMAEHPLTHDKTSQRALASALGVKPQTLSLYINGERTPNIEIALEIANYFGVSVDYMLTGISSNNKSINRMLGLSEDAITRIKQANLYKGTGDFPAPLEMINSLLSDKEFYEFLDDLGYKATNVKTVRVKQKEAKGLDLEGYYIWDLQMFVQEFILKELVKHGLKIESK